MATATTQTKSDPSTWPWPKGFDPQQESQLLQLANQNQLYGIPPQIIAYIQQAESGFGYNAGGVINSGGYGGYFGLGNNKTYNGGTATTALLHDTSAAGYAQQAHIAASAFATYMIPAGGDYVAAENLYQTGSTTSSANGAGIFEQYIGKNASGVQTGGTGAAGQALNAAGNVISDVSAPFTFLQDVLGGFGIGWKAVLTIIGGILLIGVGVLIMFRKPIEQVAPAAAMAAA